MESLSEIPWDAVIEGTGLRQSLLALALSRSSKKILHVDENTYYGGAEAAFSLQEVDEWVGKNSTGSPTSTFANATLWKSDAELAATDVEKLSFSRAYSLTLSPQIIYTRSKLLAQLVSSKVYKQLEFQAVGNWWIYHTDENEGEGRASLKRLPNGREDIFEDRSIDNRAKRSLMKFLKFVVDFENQVEMWEPHADSGLPGFLASKFQLPPHLQIVIVALTMSLDAPEETTVGWALPRIARHLTSIGVFGPGFGAVVPKWGGGAEIAQVACRAGAVGGGVYVLGTGIKDIQSSADPIEVVLTNGETVTAKHLARGIHCEGSIAAVGRKLSKAIALISSSMDTLSQSSIEGAPLAAVTVIVFPTNSLIVEGQSNTYPVYIMAHSSETGECPVGQCVAYATTLHSDISKTLLDTALKTLLNTVEDGGKLVYSLCYEQQHSATTHISAPDLSDLAFNDAVLKDVEREWRVIIGDGEEGAEFMKFQERAGMNEDGDDEDDADENDNDGY